MKSLFSAAGFLIPLILALISEPNSLMFFFWVGIGVVVAVGIEIVDDRLEKDVIPEKWKLSTINLLLESSRRIVFGSYGSLYRISIMEPDKNSNLLSIKYHKGIYGVERTVTLEPGQGCAGIAYQEERVVSADIVKYGHDKFGLGPGMASKIPSTMKSIISVPLVDLIDTESPRIRGVLSLTTSLSFDESGFNNPDVQEKLIALSDTLSRLLYQ